MSQGSHVVHCPNGGKCNHTCKFEQVANPYECSTIHRDVEELRADYKNILVSLSSLDKKIAVNGVWTALFSSLLTSIIVGAAIKLLIPLGG